MAHAFAANARQRDFNATLFADNALELHALILAAQAFIVLYWTKNARAEETVTFRLKRAVIDSFRFLDLAVRPAQNLFGARDRDFHLIESLHGDGRIERVHDVGMMVHLFSPLPLQDPQDERVLNG